MRPAPILQLLFAFCVVGVTVLSLTPGGEVSTPGQTDKILHFIAYTAMSFLALLAFRSRSTRATALIFVVVLGLVLEWAQIFVDGRSASLLDASANVLGVAAGALLYRFRGRRLEERIGA